MRFSILVPVYNVEKYFDACMRSIWAQTDQDFEVILVDDGSTDSSGAMCDRYALAMPDQVKVIHQENQGLLCARRVGIAHASGEYCVFIDSDDFIEPNLIETLNHFLDKNPGLDAVIYSFRYIRDGKPEERRIKPMEDGKIWIGEQKQILYQKLMFTNDITSIWTKAIKTSLLLADPTDYTKYYGKDMAEDLLQSLYVITSAARIGTISAVLYDYRVIPHSMSHVFHTDALKKKNTLHVHQKILDYLPIWGLDTVETRQRLVDACFGKAVWEFTNSYEQAATWAERKKVVDADWQSLLPQTDDETLRHIRPATMRWIRLIEKKRYCRLGLMYVKKKSYKKWKELKKKWMKSKSS